MNATNGYLKLFQAALGSDYYVHAEHKFHATRRWRFDLVVAPMMGLSKAEIDGSLKDRSSIMPMYYLAVEIDGGGFVTGRHSRGAGIQNDCEKYAEAMILGWRILRVTPKHIKDGRAFTWIEALLK